jgi:ABC-type lipoprotein export system ATPase subunit
MTATTPKPAEIAQPLLRAVGISRRYWRGPEIVDALHQLDLTLLPGELVALVGPSGSGKTTLLNVFCGWERPDSGHIEWRGRSDVALAGLGWSEISIVPQSSGLLEDLSLSENVSLARRLRPTPTQAAHLTRVRDDGYEAEEILARLGIEHLSEHLPRTTSLGEQQRAAVARALLLGPSLVLADEPTAHQDAVSAEKVMDLFCDVTAAGSCCLIATHNVSAVSRADRVVMLAT